MRCASRQVRAALVMLLVGCTTRDPGDSATATIADSSDSEITGPGASSGSGASSSSTGAGGSSTGTAGPPTTDPTGAVCPDVVGDAGEGPAVEIRIANARAGDVFLADMTVCVGSYVVVDGGNGTWPVPGCETCADNAVEGCGCPKFCLGLPPLRLVPGGRFTTVWDGLVFVEQAIPAGCVPECDCLLPQQAPAGTYTVTAHELTAETCESAGCGSCTPNAEGWCETDQHVDESGTPIERTLSYPRETIVEFVFE